MVTNQNNLHEQKDMSLWHTAKKRAGFKWSLLTYIVINIFFIILWFLGDSSYFWPIWCMLGWGIGLVFQYFNAYHRSSKGVFSVDKEYEKLKNQQ
jgi:hypothetical protein